MAAVDIRILGDKELERKLARLADKAQKTIVRQAVRASAKRTTARLIENISGRVISPFTGRLLAAFRAAKIRQSSEQRGLIRIGPVWPTREELGIAAGDRHYYPVAVEFGHPGAPAHPYARPAIDEHRDAELSTIGREIGAGIEREARRRG